jgi:Ser/Thr protein kinase RdoA (MazF antagonist)
MIWLPGTPAYSSIRPHSSEWYEADRELSEKVQQWAGLQGIVSKLKTDSSEVIGYYKIDSWNESFFLKIIDKNTEKFQIKSNQMSQWIESQGIRASCILKGFPRKIKELNHVILAYRMVDGRFCRPIEKETLLLGRSLGELHKVLKLCPWKRIIQQNGDARQNTLQKLLIKIQTDGCNVEVPHRVEKLLKSVDSGSMDILTINSQVVHGDLNYGNVLIDNNSECVVFLDFEDTWTAWFSPLMELSFVIERFTLLEDDEITVSLTKCLKKAYLSSGGFWYRDSDQLGRFLRALSIRALLLLIMISNREPSRQLETEWEKFLKLYEQTDHRSDLISRLSSEP